MYSILIYVLQYNNFMGPPFRELTVSQDWTTKYFHDIDLELDEIKLNHS